MLPVSKSSPENSRLLGLLFSNYLNLHIKISNFLAKSDHFEHFLKNSIFEKCFDPFCMRKNWFWDFQLSGWPRRFWAFFEKFHLWKFLQVFWLILYVKNLEFKIWLEIYAIVMEKWFMSRNLCCCNGKIMLL